MLGYRAVAAEPNGLVGGGRTVVGAGAEVTGELVRGGVATMGALPGGVVGVRSVEQSEGVHPIVIFDRS